MQSELEAAGQRVREMAESLEQLRVEEAKQRSVAQQAQHDADRLRAEAQSLSEVLAQRDSDLQVRALLPAEPLASKDTALCS